MVYETIFLEEHKPCFWLVIEASGTGENEPLLGLPLQ